MRLRQLIPLLLLIASGVPAPAQAPASDQAAEYAGWPPLERRFASTGGGGWIIDDYDPVPDRVAGLCRTNFTAISPEGQRIDNAVTFDAVPVPGGILCTNGRWRGRNDDSQGTTPFRVFIRADGARFGSP